jgi:histidinol-phosphate aminotransferase
MSKFFSKRLSALEPYNPGPQPTDKEIKLNTNENPYPPSPQVMPAVLGEIESL